jgi:Rrf2 family protein
MKLTQSVGYAVGILLRVDGLTNAKPVTATAIGEGCQFPPRFLYRVLRRLVDADLLQGVPGPGGGYRLARTLREISLLEVVEAVEGLSRPEPLKPASRKHRGAIRFVNELASSENDHLAARLARVNMAKLARL